ncbi:GtrA family protein [Cohnella herbarum]|uniref:GtrA family protein n=1 Tax=Cohnella herbarum TaxID=2728023 RepID=A0A7Z2VN81_9BACL|nr:GtrA family protein [Cohnella herbarum]QJD86024.1 GtrA family protein [Cohnella herbarum]
MKFKVVMKYGMVGVVGTVIHFLLLILLVERFNMNPVLSSACGFLVVLLVSYLLNKYWTFPSSQSGWRSITKYTVVSVSGLLLNTGIMYVAVEKLHWRYTVGQALVTLIIPAFNFALNYYWTFRKTPARTYNG